MRAAQVGLLGADVAFLAGSLSATAQGSSLILGVQIMGGALLILAYAALRGFVLRREDDWLTHACGTVGSRGSVAAIALLVAQIDLVVGIIFGLGSLALLRMFTVDSLSATLSDLRLALEHVRDRRQTNRRR